MLPFQSQQVEPFTKVQHIGCNLVRAFLLRTVSLTCGGDACSERLNLAFSVPGSVEWTDGMWNKDAFLTRDNVAVACEELVAVANQDSELKRNVGVLHYYQKNAVCGFHVNSEFL